VISRGDYVQRIAARQTPASVAIQIPDDSKFPLIGSIFGEALILPKNNHRAKSTTSACPIYQFECQVITKSRRISAMEISFPFRGAINQNLANFICGQHS